MADIFHFDPAPTLDIINDELELLAWRIQENLASTGTNASGRTSRSLHVKMRDNGGALVGRSFFSVVETGRRAGRVPRNFQGIILQWMEDKGVHADDGDDDKMARGIAWKIRRMGSSLYRKGGRADIYSNEIAVTKESLSKRISDMVAQTFMSEIKLNYTGTIK